MKKIKKVKFNKIAAFAIIVSVSGSVSPAYAITSSNNKSPNTNISNSQHYRNSVNINKLSTTGIISKAQETIISNLFVAYKNSISKAIKDNFSHKLDGLINLGTITQLQKKEIMNLYTVSKTNTDELININTLVASKTITKNQEITIINSFMQCKKSTSKTINNILLSKLDKLISVGTINDNQRAAVINLAKISNVD